MTWTSRFGLKLCVATVRRAGATRARWPGRWAEIAAHSSASTQKQQEWSAGALLALAYPERIAKNRGGAAGGFVLVNGRGAQVDRSSPLAREPYLAVAELTGSAAASRILSAAPMTLGEIEAHFADRIVARQRNLLRCGDGELAHAPAAAARRHRTRRTADAGCCQRRSSARLGRRRGAARDRALAVDESRFRNGATA